MGSKSLKTTFRDYTRDAVFTTLILEGSVFVANTYLGYNSDYVWPIVAGIGYQAYRQLMDGSPRRQTSIAAGRMQSTRRMAVNGKTTFYQRFQFVLSGDPDILTRQVRYDEPFGRGEFYWTVPLPDRVEPVRIFETRLLSFCQAVHARQSSSDEHARRYPTSRNQLCDPGRRPYFRPTVYNACIGILRACDLLDGWGQGRAGRLIYTPRHTVGVAKYTYSAVAG